MCGALGIRQAIRDCLKLDAPTGDEVVGTLYVEHPTVWLCAQC
jgi:hypothetical protein